MNGLGERVQVGGVMRLEVPGAEALLHDGGAEYALKSGATGCWITVDSLSVHLSREQGRLLVQVFPLLEEGQGAISSMEVENSTPF